VGLARHRHRVSVLGVDGLYASLAPREDFMPDWLWFIAFFVVYIVLMRWVLPRLGVPT
jgi:hypothetical protein